MKRLFYILLTVIAITGFQGCDYLDIVPDERATDKDAFKDAAAALRYLYSCYGYLAGEEADPRHPTKSIDLFTADEVVTPYEHEVFANFAKGTYSPSEPRISYWNNVFAGIRQCYLLLENVDGVPGLTESNKRTYKAEATFLIAYYHYLLIKNYGPTIIVRERAKVETSPEFFLPREPYDDCVKWVADKFDEAIEMGLYTYDQILRDPRMYGRATVAAAKAIKARMLLYAASPLFNGGSYKDVPDVDPELLADADDVSNDYRNFKDKAGKQLISTTYDPKKWEIAAAACEEAIREAEAEGHYLYYAGLNLSIPFPLNQYERNVRLAITDKYTNEIIWASTTEEDAAYSVQAKSTPYCSSAKINWKGSWNGLAPRLNMVEAFYSANGLPIDVDPDYNYEERYKYGEQSDTEHGSGVTMNLNMNREPRFYSWISFHNGYYELIRGNDQDAVSRIITKFRSIDEQGKQGKNNDFSPSGYLNKKGVHPLYAQYANGGVIPDAKYPWPIIRLGELYLNYAEALVELGEVNEAKKWIDKVRERAGLKSLDQSWSKVPGANLNRQLMRKIVRQERQIEMYLENQRFWDVRRWLVGTKYLDVPCEGMNVEGKQNAEFFMVTELTVIRKFQSPTNYLMPIPMGDINKNPNIVQNPGYDDAVEETETE